MGSIYMAYDIMDVIYIYIKELECINTLRSLSMVDKKFSKLFNDNEKFIRLMCCIKLAKRCIQMIEDCRKILK
jgi:hypothetical protein